MRCDNGEQLNGRYGPGNPTRLGPGCGDRSTVGRPGQINDTVCVNAPISIENEIATIGISNHAQESLGDIVFIELPSVGNSVKAKDEICVVESVKAASDIYAPIDGEIIEVNKNLENDAAIINQDPENEGWIFKMKISDSNQYSELMSEDEYKQFLEQ